jgi:hypothetical protein
MGPPVYDPYYRCWTFPYAKVRRREPPRDVIVGEKRRVTFEAATHMTPDDKALLYPGVDANVHTTEDKATHMEAEKDTQTGGHRNAGVQTRRRKGLDPNSAALVIMRFLMRLRRARALRQMDPPPPWKLFRRARARDPASGHLLIMSMYVGHEFLSDRCTYVLFRLFDYARARLIGEVRYEGDEGSLAELKAFIVDDLYKYARPVLIGLRFERAPFTRHYEALLQVIQEKRCVRDPLLDYSIGSDSDSLRPATPPPMYEFDEAETRDRPTGMQLRQMDGV